VLPESQIDVKFHCKLIFNRTVLRCIGQLAYVFIALIARTREKEELAVQVQPCMAAPVGKVVQQMIVNCLRAKTRQLGPE